MRVVAPAVLAASLAPAGASSPPQCHDLSGAYAPGKARSALMLQAAPLGSG
jgi:hypothetical protein